MTNLTIVGVEPEVIPLQSLGVVDVGTTDVPDSTILAHALAKYSQTDIDQSYAVKRSSDFVNEYPRTDDSDVQIDGRYENPNHLMGCFPDLMPYAKGGAGLDRPVKVSYEAHADWAMQYEDGRFAKHLQYMFQVFGVIQKHQIASSASLQITRKDFVRNEEAIRSLKPTDLLIVAGEESRRVPFSNPTVQCLRKHVSAVRAKIMGTDESRIKIRRQIWSTIVMLGPPSLWITINPSDTNDPIAQVLAGSDIDLNNFMPDSGPNSQTRSYKMASDPHAASEFFHLIIDAVLEELFGLSGHTAHRNRKTRQEGIFGKVASYVGTVEAQGRGTLHLHMILWLCGAPTTEKMKSLLKNESFRCQVMEFITSNIKADVDGTNMGEMVESHRERAVSYSRPVDPHEDDYGNAKVKMERRLVRAVQLHKCTKEACLVLKKNRLQCKR